jgi:hypothetical protein
LTLVNTTIQAQKLIEVSTASKVLKTGFNSGVRHVRVPDTPELEFTGDFTAKIKVKFIGNTISGALISKGGGSENSIHILLDIENGSNLLMWQGLGTYVSVLEHPTILQKYKWYTFIASREGSTLKISVDGGAYVTKTFAGTTVIQDFPVCFGSYIGVGNSATEALWEQAAMWDRALTVSEAMSNTPTNMLLDYRFNGDTLDKSGNNNHGTPYYTYTEQAIGVFAPHYVGKF